MNRETFTRAREIADASGLLGKAASISAGRGLTGAQAVEHAAGLYLAAVDQMAAELQAGADAERERVMTIINSDAAAQRPGMARKLALESNLTAAQAIERLQGATLRSVPADDDAEDAANFILGAGHDDD